MINLSHKVIARRELNMAPLFSLFLAMAAFLYMCRNSQQLSDPNVPLLDRGEKWDDSDPENWQKHDMYELAPSIDNLFNRTYATFGILAELEIDLDEVPNASDPRFIGPGAPRSAYTGFRVRF